MKLLFTETGTKQNSTLYINYSINGDEISAYFLKKNLDFHIMHKNKIYLDLKF